MDAETKRALLTVGSTVEVITNAYGSDHYQETGTITAIDHSLAMDTRWRVLFADGDYEYMFDDEIAPHPAHPLPAPTGEDDHVSTD